MYMKDFNNSFVEDSHLVYNIAKGAIDGVVAGLGAVGEVE